VKSIVCAGVTSMTLLCGCSESTDGTGTAAPDAGSSPAGTSAATSTATASATTEPSPPEMPVFGVLETTRRPLGPDALTCEPPERPAGAQQVSFSQPAPGIPLITIMIPETWTTAVAQNDPTMSMTGPDGLTGRLTVTPTDLDPAAAFEKYSDDVTAEAPISSVSVLPAELCGYSGQELMGMLSGGEGDGIEYRDRIAHVWTDGPSYLVAIHVEGPQGGEALSAAADLILADFGVQIP